MTYEIINADVMAWAESYEGEPFHAILTDPPYALGFMGKAWDGEVAFMPATWKALACHLHPGGFLMAFASSRGWHRLAVAIEDAGLIIHPSIFGWAQGQGFPKATRIDAQIDKAAGNIRENKSEFIGVSIGKDNTKNINRYKRCKECGKPLLGQDYCQCDWRVNPAVSPLAQAWQGHRYGLQAMKPSIEPVICARKPLTDCAYYDILGETHLAMEVFLCRFINVSVVERLLSEQGLSQSEANEDSVRLSATLLQYVLTQQQELDQMDMWQSSEVASILLSIVSLWNDICNALLNPGSTFTIEMATEATTSLRILKSWLLMNTPECLIQAVFHQNGVKLSVLTVAKNLSGSKSSSRPIPIHSVTENVFLNTNEKIDGESVNTAASHSKLDAKQSKIADVIALLNVITKVNGNQEDLILLARSAASLLESLPGKLRTSSTTNARGALDITILAQKPYAGRPVDSITETGAGAINIDGGRIGIEGGETHQGGFRGKHGIYGGSEEVKTDLTKKGRWPSNLYLQHSPDCVRLGTRRVKGDKRDGSIQDVTARSGLNHSIEGIAIQGHADADGLETVAAWRCFKGWEGEIPSYAYRNDVLTPLDDAAYFLDRLLSLREDLQHYSMSGNSLSRNVSEVYHNGRILSEVSGDDLFDDVSCALLVSGFPGFQVDCPSCRRLCDGLLRRVLVAAQDDLPSLPDVLAVVHLDLSSLLHSPRCQAHAPLSSSDDLGLTCHEIDSVTNNRPDTYPSLLILPETESGILDKTGSDVGPCGEPENILENRTPDGGSRVSQCCSACSTAIVKLVSLLCADLAWRLLLPGQIIQRNEIHVKLNPCPVWRLGEQSGERKSGRSNNNAAVGEQSRGVTPLRRGNLISRNDKGTAARFFMNADWSHEVAERLATCDPVKYQAKAGRKEKDAGLEGFEEKRKVYRATANGTGEPSKGQERFTSFMRNPHPTVKPIALTRWLSTLLLPPELYAPRRLLIPFAGVMSEAIGAHLAGWEEIVAIEMEEEYTEIGRPRMDWWIAKKEETGLTEPKVILKTCSKKPNNKKSNKKSTQGKLL